MMNVLLTLHLVGAGVLVIVLFKAVFTKRYIRYAKLIGINTTAQLASGSLLAVVGQSMGISQVCLNIGAYLVVVLLVEAILLRHVIRDQHFARVVA